MPDIVPNVPWKEVASPNHGGIRATTLGAFIHSTRGGTSTPAAEYLATVRYLSRTNASQAGTHFVVGHNEVTRMIHDPVICWNQTIDNDTHLGMEIVQQTPTTPYVEFQYVAAADIGAQWAHEFGFPIVNVGRQTTVNVEVKGFIGHDQARSGWSRGKSDPGAMWDWNKFINMCKATYDRLYAPPVVINWEGIIPELHKYMTDNKLVPRPETALRFLDGVGQQYVWFKPMSGAPTGGIAMWRKSLNRGYHWGF